MPRPKKDGKMLNLYIDKKVIDRLEKYAEEKGQTKTIAVERLLTKALDIEENKKMIINKAIVIKRTST